MFKIPLLIKFTLKFFDYNYYTFGSPMNARQFNLASSRYGFNGKESDNEVKGTGNEVDYGMRIYDPRIGKFLSVDHLTSKYPHYSPYHFAGNTPIIAKDIDGNEDLWVHYSQSEDGTFTEVTRQYDVSGLQRQAISSSMGGANIPNTVVVYTFEHYDGTKEVKKVGETVNVSVYKDNAAVRWLKAADNLVTSSMVAKQQ
jgi:RHS repeat-associated protein